MEQECQRLRLESQSAQGYLTDHGRRDKEKELRFQKEVVALQAETAWLFREQQALVSERQAAHQAGVRAREMEVHVQKQFAELDQQHQKDWQFMQEKHMALQKQTESLVNDLIVCQDMIFEKAQTHPPQQSPVLEQVRPLASTRSSPGLGPEKSGSWMEHLGPRHVDGRW